jgi:hypothetical protein
MRARLFSTTDIVRRKSAVRKPEEKRGAPEVGST